MADVKIKGYSGTYLGYQDVPKVWLAAPESTEDNPVLVPFTYGEAVEGVEVVPDFSAGDMPITMEDGYLAKSAVLKKPETLLPENVKNGVEVAGVVGEYEGETLETEEVTLAADFSGGDMVVEPTEGKYLSKATVTKPETLVPENIAAGVDIAGIIGTFIGGSNVKTATGLDTSTTLEITIQHGLGVIPDLIYAVAASRAYSTERSFLSSCFGISQKLKEQSGNAYNMAYTGYSTSGIGTVYKNSNDFEDEGVHPIHTVNEESFKIGGYAYGGFYTTVDVYWIAISGLT